jgi:hypothetical protein
MRASHEVVLGRANRLGEPFRRRPVDGKENGSAGGLALPVAYREWILNGNSGDRNGRREEGVSINDLNPLRSAR